MRQGCQPYAPTTPQKINPVLILLESETTTGPKYDRKDYVNDTNEKRTRDLPACSTVRRPTAPPPAPCIGPTAYYHVMSMLRMPGTRELYLSYTPAIPGVVLNEE